MEVVEPRPMTSRSSRVILASQGRRLQEYKPWEMEKSVLSQGEQGLEKF